MDLIGKYIKNCFDFSSIPKSFENFKKLPIDRKVGVIVSSVLSLPLLLFGAVGTFQTMTNFFAGKQVQQKEKDRISVTIHRDSIDVKKNTEGTIQGPKIEVEVPREQKKEAYQIFSALENDDAELMAELMQKGFDMYSGMDDDNNTPVHLAAKNGKINCLKFFLNRADRLGDAALLQKTQRSGKTLLHLAAGYGHKECVDILLKRKDIDVNYKDKNQQLGVENFKVRMGEFLKNSSR